MFSVPLSARTSFRIFVALCRQSMKYDAVTLGLLFVEATLPQSILRLKPSIHPWMANPKGCSLS